MIAVGISHVQAGVITISLAVIAVCNLYRCLPGRSK